MVGDLGDHALSTILDIYDARPLPLLPLFYIYFSPSDVVVGRLRVKMSESPYLDVVVAIDKEGVLNFSQRHLDRALAYV